MNTHTTESIKKFLKVKNSSNNPPPFGLVSVAFLLFGLGMYSGLKLIELVLLSIPQFVFSFFTILKTYNKVLNDKQNNLYSGLYGISLSLYSQLLFFFSNFKRDSTQTLFVSALILLFNIAIVFSLLLYVCKKIKKGIISKAAYALSSGAGLGAVASIVFSRHYMGEPIFIANTSYILSSLIFSSFVLCIFKFMLYQLIDIDITNKKNIFVWLLESGKIEDDA